MPRITPRHLPTGIFKESATKRTTVSHSVTIGTQTMMRNSMLLILNIGYLKTWAGIVKMLQLALGIVCVSIIGHQFTMYSIHDTVESFFLVITASFLIGTAILLISCVLSYSTACIIAETLYEFIYHSAAFGFYLASSLTFLLNIYNEKSLRNQLFPENMSNVQTRKGEHFMEGSTNSSSWGNGTLMVGAICGLMNSALYLFSTIMAVRTGL